MPIVYGPGFLWWHHYSGKSLNSSYMAFKSFTIWFLPAFLASSLFQKQIYLMVLDTLSYLLCSCCFLLLKCPDCLPSSLCQSMFKFKIHPQCYPRDKIIAFCSFSSCHLFWMILASMRMTHLIPYF